MPFCAVVGFTLLAELAEAEGVNMPSRAWIEAIRLGLRSSMIRQPSICSSLRPVQGMEEKHISRWRHVKRKESGIANPSFP